MPSVSAVIVTYNGGSNVLRCIEKAKAQTRPFDEIIVVDNASTDGSPKEIRSAHPDVQLIEMPDNRGPSVSRNAGLAAAKCEFVFWIDNDLYPEDSCLENLLAALATVSADFLVPRVVLVPETHIVQADGGDAHFIGMLSLRHGFRPLRQINDHAIARITAFSSSCMFVRRDMALQFGGFDETFFFYFEDYEFSFRSSIFGAKMLSVPSACAFHDRGAGYAGLSLRDGGPYPRRRAYLQSRNRLRTVMTHYSARTLFVLAPALLFYEFVGLGLAMMRGWTGAWWDAWVWVFRHRRLIVNRRRWVQSQRTVPDRDILTGGPLSIAPGLMTSGVVRWAASFVSVALNFYWRLVRWLI